MAFDAEPGDTIPIRAHNDEAVQESGLTALVVASSGVALASPLLAAATILWIRKTKPKRTP